MLRYDDLLAFRPKKASVKYSAKDLILYALAVGAGRELPAGDARKFVYERELIPVASYYSILGWHEPSWLYSLGIDMKRMVQWGESVEIFEPLRPEGAVLLDRSIESAVDRGAEKGLIVEVVCEMLNASDGRRIARMSSTLLCLGDGGLPGAPSPAKPSNPGACHQIADGAREGSVTFRTAFDQAAMYRLCGDLNPIHIDPVAASVAGFRTPILHGLCSLASSIFVVAQAEDIAQSEIGGFSGRFSAPVVPGETISIDYWRMGEDLKFEARVDAKPVVKAGVIRLRGGEQNGN